MVEEGRELGGKAEDASGLEPIERLFANTITGKKQGFGQLVIDGEGKHSVQPLQ